MGISRHGISVAFHEPSVHTKNLPFRNKLMWHFDTQPLHNMSLSLKHYVRTLRIKIFSSWQILFLADSSLAILQPSHSSCELWWKYFFYLYYLYILTDLLRNCCISFLRIRMHTVSMPYHLNAMQSLLV